MQRNLMLVGIAILLILGGAIYIGSRSMSEQTAPQETVSQEDEQQPIGGSPNGEVKTFDVKGTSFNFEPKEIRVKKGDTVRITLTNTDANNPQRPHDLVIEGFNVKTKQFPINQSETIEFVADKTGTFEFYCSVGNGYHRQQGMVGMLIVE